MKNLKLAKMATLITAFCTLAGASASAQKYQAIAAFDGTNGANPYYGVLAQGFDGNFYGTTQLGGANSKGTIFRVTPQGTLTTIYSFCAKSNCTDGSEPVWGVLLATNGNFYGTTYYGGAYNEGTIFEITPAGELTTLYSFCAASGCPDGAFPTALIQATDGNLYGTTEYGGLGASYGTVFEIALTGALRTLHSFGFTDGAYPTGSLVQAANGSFYGTTYSGGANGGYGTVFQITRGGTFSTLHNFDVTDGAGPSGLTQIANGNLYGVTVGGGVRTRDFCFDQGCGTVFEITPAGTLTTLYSFCSEGIDCDDGFAPYGALVLAANGQLYGTTYGGGFGNGLIYQMGPTGKPKTIYNFCPEHNCVDGGEPEAALLLSTNGTFYGTTNYGGANEDGTVFSLVVGLLPFVKTLPTSAKDGAEIAILGNDLTGTTAVTFNDKAAAFTVVSDTEITAIVPTGATTGTVTVTTPSRILNSNVPFRVIP